MSGEGRKRFTFWKRLGRFETDADYLRAAALAGSPDVLSQVLARLGEWRVLLSSLEAALVENPDVKFAIGEIIDTAKYDLETVLRALKAS